MNKITEINTDVVIVGTGVSGLYCALNLPISMNIVMITKSDEESSDSFLAQGGICVLRDKDDYNSFFEDTMRAGHYENRKESVDIMIRSSRNVIQDLVRYGVEFERKINHNATEISCEDKQFVISKQNTLDNVLEDNTDFVKKNSNQDGNDSFLYTKEGAHSKPRILYHKDITGQEITSKLLARVKERSNIVIYEYTTMTDLIVEDDICKGILAEDKEKYIKIYAKNTVLATGGIGGNYTHSTNYPHLTGDAIRLAQKYNIKLENLDYVQIHPTTLYSKKAGRRFLISESVRGEGAILLNKQGERFVNELLPRDVVTEAIRKQMKEDNTEYVWLSMKPISQEEIMEHFPNIYKKCLEEGYDVTKDPIPVVPAQHYFMGGIWVDSDSKTSMKQLYAVGETSCNGVHGANRLASNSLLESLVFAKRASRHISKII